MDVPSYWLSMNKRQTPDSHCQSHVSESGLSGHDQVWMGDVSEGGDNERYCLNSFVNCSECVSSRLHPKYETVLGSYADIEHALDACEAQLGKDAAGAQENGKDYRCYMGRAGDMPTREKVLE